MWSFRTNKYMFKKKMIQKYSADLEPILRKMVRDGVEDAIQRYSPCNLRSLPNVEIGACESRSVKLVFENKLPLELFTENKVESEWFSPIKIMLVDSISGNLITHGPLSKKKVKIVVLHGDFKAEKLEIWTNTQFCNHIIEKRNAQKRPLLTGECFVTLNNGIGFIQKILFTDNSSWVRSKMFRLGAMIEGEEDKIKEAVSNPFHVKDRRGESYRKSKDPSPDDEVWRIKGIAKNGTICQRLKKNNIFKVKDLITYQNNEIKLHKILKVPQSKCKAIIKRAAAGFLSKINLDQNTNSSSNIQQFYFNDEEQIQMSQVYGGNNSNSIATNHCFFEDLETGYGQDYSVPLNSAPTPFFPVQTMAEQVNNFTMDSNNDPSIGLHSLVLGVGATVSMTSGPLNELEKIFRKDID
ncbi:unnamed protein product [Amaranthus hypochondriacus]